MNYDIARAFGTRYSGAPALRADVPGMERSRQYPTRMANFHENFLPTWRDPPHVQYAEDWFNYLVPIPTLAPGASAQVSLNIEADSAFEWIQAIVAAPPAATGNVNPTPQIQCMVTDGASSRNLFSAPLFVANFAGSAQLPWILPIPRRFMAKSTVLFNFTNVDTAVTYSNAMLALGGRKIFARDDPALLGSIARFRTWEDPARPGSFYSEDLFVYAWNIGNSAAASAPIVVTTLMEADSDFTAISAAQIGYTATTGPSLNIATQQTVIIRDGATTRQFSSVNTTGNPNQNGYLVDFFGAAGLPQILPVARIFKAKSPVTMTVQNVDTAVNIFNTQLVLQGRKIFELN